MTQWKSRSFMCAAAWLLVTVFACVPALSRVHDHLSSSDRAAGFRFSKNIERPHERLTAVPLLVIAGTLLDNRDLSPTANAAALDTPPSHSDALPAPGPVRAPPAS